MNWNGKAFMQKFIPLILARTCFSGGSALYVADNGSQDGSVEWLRATWPDGEVRLIRLDRNYGFTGGYNRAFAEIERSGERFDYYLLLNSDIEVTDGWGYGRMARGTGEVYGFPSPLRSMCSEDSEL